MILPAHDAYKLAADTAKRRLEERRSEQRRKAATERLKKKLAKRFFDCASNGEFETSISRIDQDILDWLAKLGLSTRSWKRNNSAVARLQSVLEEKKAECHDLQLGIARSGDLHRYLPKGKTLQDILEYYWSLGKIEPGDRKSKLTEILAELDGMSRARLDIVRDDLHSLMKVFLDIKEVELKLSEYLTDDRQAVGNSGVMVSWRDCKYYSSITSEICGPLLLWISYSQGSVSSIIDIIIRRAAEDGYKCATLRCNFEKDIWMLDGYVLGERQYSLRPQEFSPFAAYTILTGAGYSLDSSIPSFPLGKVRDNHFRFLMAEDGESHSIELRWH
jgi:hypothetical protein